jgi:hypothetical protein
MCCKVSSKVLSNLNSTPDSRSFTIWLLTFVPLAGWLFHFIIVSPPFEVFVRAKPYYCGIVLLILDKGYIWITS